MVHIIRMFVWVIKQSFSKSLLLLYSHQSYALVVYKGQGVTGGMSLRYVIKE